MNAGAWDSSITKKPPHGRFWSFETTENDSSEINLAIESKTSSLELLLSNFILFK
jgi:hypothetical protein